MRSVVDHLFSRIRGKTAFFNAVKVSGSLKKEVTLRYPHMGMGTGMFHGGGSLLSHNLFLGILRRAGRFPSDPIRPYKTTDNRIDGALVTLEDINELKLGMMRIQESRDYAEAIVETVREPLIVMNKDLLVVTANQA